MRGTGNLYIGGLRSLITLEGATFSNTQQNRIEERYCLNNIKISKLSDSFAKNLICVRKFTKIFLLLNYFFVLTTYILIFT